MRQSHFLKTITKSRKPLEICYNENHDIAIAMSPSRADPVLPWLGLFKYLNQCYCPGWRYLNIYISVTALAGGI